MGNAQDIELQKKAKQALQQDDRVSAGDISIVANQGRVKLRGYVCSPLEKRLAAQIVAGLDGIIEVQNDLEVEPIEHERDLGLTAAVKRALRRDDYVDDSDIKVEIQGDTAFLSGSVVHRWERANAEIAAQSVPGIETVVNAIRVLSTPLRPDQEIKQQIKEDMARNIRLDPSRIDVKVSNGVVYLKGRVPNMSQKWLAADESWRTPGVRDVVNDLAVE